MNFVPDLDANRINRINNAGEKIIYRELQKSDKYKDYYCFHSIIIPEHRKKMIGEIDFVLLGSEGIICLEVKGSRSIKRSNGLWEYDGYTSYESPFRQVSDSMFDLINDLNNYLYQQSVEFNLNDFRYFGVLFPQCQFNIESEEWSNNIVYSLSDRNYNIDKYISRVLNHWQSKFNHNKLLENHIINQCKDYLRGNFYIPESIFSKLRNISEDRQKLTTEQLIVFKGLYKNNQILVDGVAGTGKTILAKKCAIDHSLEGKKTGLICFNNLLSHKLSMDLKDEIKDGHLFISTLHQYMLNTIKSDPDISKNYDKIKNTYNTDTLFKKVIPEYFLKSSRNNPFDVLIIDEGQDILNWNYFDVLNSMVKNGIENGNWIFFFDSRIQSEIYSEYNQEVIDLLKEKAAYYILQENMRNTEKIINTIDSFTGYNISTFKSKIEGETVIFKTYKSEKEAIKLLTAILNNLLRDPDISKKSIDILTQCRLDKSIIVKNLNQITNYNIKELNTGNVEKKEDFIGITSVYKYKGLENDIIILTDINNKCDNPDAVNYTGMSRARSLLYILIEENILVENKNKKYNIRN